jgi:hypothetical protein
MYSSASSGERPRSTPTIKRSLGEGCQFARSGLSSACEGRHGPGGERHAEATTAEVSDETESDVKRETHLSRSRRRNKTSRVFLRIAQRRSGGHSPLLEVARSATILTTLTGSLRSELSNPCGFDHHVSQSDSPRTGLERTSTSFATPFQSPNSDNVSTSSPSTAASILSTRYSLDGSELPFSSEVRSPTIEGRRARYALNCRATKSVSALSVQTISTKRHYIPYCRAIRSHAPKRLVPRARRSDRARILRGCRDQGQRRGSLRAP